MARKASPISLIASLLSLYNIDASAFLHFCGFFDASNEIALYIADKGILFRVSFDSMTELLPYVRPVVSSRDELSFSLKVTVKASDKKALLESGEAEEIGTIEEIEKIAVSYHCTFSDALEHKEAEVQEFNDCTNYVDFFAYVNPNRSAHFADSSDVLCSVSEDGETVHHYKGVSVKSDIENKGSTVCSLHSIAVWLKNHPIQWARLEGFCANPVLAESPMGKDIVKGFHAVKAYLILSNQYPEA